MAKDQISSRTVVPFSLPSLTFSLLSFSHLLSSLSPLTLFDLYLYLPIILTPLNFYLPTYGLSFPIRQHQLRYSDNDISTTNGLLDITTTHRASTARIFFRIKRWTTRRRSGNWLGKGSYRTLLYKKLSILPPFLFCFSLFHSPVPLPTRGQGHGTTSSVHASFTTLGWSPSRPR